MENMIPLNGRIAIVDDQIDQALPLMRVFAKNNIPYLFYKGTDPEFLPERPENDIRILFLDLNLLDGRDYQPKDIRSTLFATISHIISPNNYPYLLILWSRQEKEYRGILEDLFAEELRQCAPIAILNWIKSDFFPNFTDTNENKENEYIILDELKKTLSTLPAYSYLMQWENCIHNSADETIQNIFHDSHSIGNWQNSANCIFEMFANSYLGKHHNEASLGERAKASLLFLNDVYHDTLESNVVIGDYSNATDLRYEVDEECQKTIAAKINECLLLSEQFDSFRQPGCVLPVDLTQDNESHFHELFYECFNKKELSSKDAKLLKKEIYKTLQPCAVVVTPACDYAQKKMKYDRLIQGLIIEEKFFCYINSLSDTFYLSPIFNLNGQRCFFVLNFRYFITYNMENEDLNPMFRIRDSILAEIQSKLARHINRQGIMSL